MNWTIKEKLMHFKSFQSFETQGMIYSIYYIKKCIKIVTLPLYVSSYVLIFAAENILMSAKQSARNVFDSLSLYQVCKLCKAT